MNKKIFNYNVVFQEEKSGGFSAWVPELPGCASQGETLEETLANVKEAIGLYLEGSKIKSTKLDFIRQFVLPVQIHAKVA